jgi:hypothetical protein
VGEAQTLLTTAALHPLLQNCVVVQTLSQVPQ